MRSFILSIIIFAILLTAVIANSIYIHRSCDKMAQLSLSLKETDIEGAQELSTLWQKCQPIFSISIHDSHIEKVTELTENIKSAVTLGNGAEFNKSIILLVKLLEELKQNEEISFQGII